MSTKELGPELDHQNPGGGGFMIDQHNCVERIRAALEDFDGWVAFAWKYIEVLFDHYTVLPDDPDPIKLVEHYQEERNFTVEFAGKLEAARRKMVEAVNAAVAVAAPSEERRWNNFCASFQCFDRDMSVSWKGFEIVLDHYEAHRPDDPQKPAEHYREERDFAIDFARKLSRERRNLEEYEASPGAAP